MSAVKAPGKWIRDLGPDTLLVEAARRVLTVRLEAVEIMLPLAAERADDDVEYVHQLRVATRRSDAALRIFESCLERGPSRKARKRLRRLRRAAGAARECDVHRELLAAVRDQEGGVIGDVIAQVLKRLAKERRKAQKSIRQAAARYPAKKLRRGRRKLMGSLRHPDPAADGNEPRLADAARRALPELIGALRAAAAADLQVLENLHRMRIAGKRLRYALEIFAPCYGATFREAYANVEALQEHLGAINDSHELVARLEAFAQRAASGARGKRRSASVRREAIDFHLRQRRERVDRFLAVWQGGAEDRLFAALGNLVAASPPAPIATTPAAERPALSAAEAAALGVTFTEGSP